MRVFRHLVFMIIPLLYSCTHKNPKAHAEAIALLKDQNGENIGNVTFVRQGDETLVITHLYHLEPNSVHGVHIHEYGNCSGDFSQTGEHFNPDHHEHGGINQFSHAGDLGNIKANSLGEANYTLKTENISVSENSHSVLGRSIMIDQGEDDLKSTPRGNSGDGIACGIIESI